MEQKENSVEKTLNDKIDNLS